jgi:hypothetical protein
MFTVVFTYFILLNFSGFRSSDLHQHPVHRNQHLELKARSTIWARALLCRQHLAVYLPGSETGQVYNNLFKTLIFSLCNKWWPMSPALGKLAHCNMFNKSYWRRKLIDDSFLSSPVLTTIIKTAMSIWYPTYEMLITADKLESDSITR